MPKGVRWLIVSIAIKYLWIFLTLVIALDKPVIISHGNPRALKNHGRNYDDEQLNACARSGGVVCINGVSRFLNDENASTNAMVEAVDYVVQLIGIDHVGFGLDFVYDKDLDKGSEGLDLNHWWPPEHGYAKASEGFLNISYAPPERFLDMTVLFENRGYTEQQIKAIYGENMYALAQKVWR